MINYRNEKKRYKPNELGSLYIDEKKLNKNEQPIIYIGGQMEHRFHALEQTGYTFDPGHNMFTGSWFYDYPLFSKNKEQYNAENFSDNLIKSLEESNLNDVIFVTESFGGIIASLATTSERVDKVIAIHPSIVGTPLANPYYLEDFKRFFTQRQKLIVEMLKLIVNPKYGFEQDNFKGIDLTKVDLNKLLVVGSYIDREKENNSLVLELDDMIEKVTSSRSDGIVVFEPDLLEQLGINYMLEEENTNHFEASKKGHIEKVIKKVMK